MKIMKCKMCGKDLIIVDGGVVPCCESVLLMALKKKMKVHVLMLEMTEAEIVERIKDYMVKSD